MHPYLVADLSDGGILVKCSKAAIVGVKDINAYT
jgi:hypothetical protein